MFFSFNYNTNFNLKGERRMVKLTKEINSEVNQFIESMGLNEKELKLRNNDDRLLYYHNYINLKCNKFCQKIEFPNLYHLILANMLCHSDENYEEFMNTYYDEDNIVSSIDAYKKYIKSTRQNERDIIKKLNLAIVNKEWASLWLMIQELFIEPVDEYHMNKIISMVESGINAQDIYAWYKSGNRFIAMLSMNVEYLLRCRN